MPINSATLICYDYETSSVNPETTQALSLGAVAINPRTLEIKPNSDFYSLIRPEKPEEVEAGALAVNKLSMDDLMKAPSIDVVWTDYVKYVEQFNWKKTSWTAPIQTGYNLRAFDAIITRRLCERFGQFKDGKQTLFSNFASFDLLDDIWRWFDDSNEIKNRKLDTVREYLGIDASQAHNALIDCKQTAEILCRFLKLYRTLFKKVKLKDSFAA